MKKLMAVLIVVGLVLGLGGVARAGVIADSVPEFWAGAARGICPTQGHANWYYGYWDKGTDFDGYQPHTDFVFAHGFYFNATEPYGWPPDKGRCMMYNMWPTYACLSSHGGHPGAPPQHSELHVIRRWVSEVTGSIVITGEYDVYSNSSNGIDLRMYREGVVFYAQYVPPGRGKGNPPYPTYSVSVDVVAGDFLDFAIEPHGGAYGDMSNDTTLFTIVITYEPPVPEPAGLIGFGLLALCRRRRS